MDAFLTGLIAGYGIAILWGAIAILIVDVDIRRGFPPALVAGAGTATTDLSTQGWPSSGRRGTYARFLGLTIINPTTIVYFAAVIIGR